MLQGGARVRNCIYYSLQEYDDPECLARSLDLGSCVVYCYESDGVDHSAEGDHVTGISLPREGSLH
jgi:hypothetical protein